MEVDDHADYVRIMFELGGNTMRSAKNNLSYVCLDFAIIIYLLLLLRTGHVAMGYDKFVDNVRHAYMYTHIYFDKVDSYEYCISLTCVYLQH